jgi:hypothetical protein
MGLWRLKEVAYSAYPVLWRSESDRWWFVLDKPVRCWFRLCLVFNDMWTACDLVSPLRLRSTVEKQGHNAW